MRNVGSAIINAERASIVDPVHAAYVQDELLSFTTMAATSNAALDADCAPTFVMRPSDALAYAAFRNAASATSYLRVIDTTVASDFQLSSASAYSIAYETMRHGLINASGTVYIYSADMTGSGVQCKRATLASTTNPPSVTFSDYGPLFGDPLADSSSLVRRCEAVCPTDGGVIVCIGTHDFTAGLSTLQFYLLPDASTAVQLNTLIQMPLTETYTNWYSVAKACSMVTAVYNAADDRIIVVASDQVHGRAVSFSIQNGVESALRPIVPVDPDASSITIRPYSLSVLGGVYYLTARFARTSSAQYTTGFDCYLTSADGVNWSFGERSFYIGGVDAKGTLLMRGDSPSVVVYAGNNAAWTAPPTKLQSSSSALRTTITDYIADWSLSQVANGADKLTMTIVNPPTSGGDGVLTGDASVTRGGVIYLQSGQGATLADVGSYSIDQVDDAVSTDGRTALKVQARDAGSKRMIDTSFVLAMPFATRVTVSSQMAALASLTIRTPAVGVAADSVNGWTYSARNDPLIAYCDTDDSGDVLMKATVTATGSDAYHLASMGFVFGASDAGAGSVLLVPKTSSWDLGGGAPDRPVVRALSLRGVDPADPDKADTGWNLSSHVNSLWQSVLDPLTSSVGGVRTAAIAAPAPRVNGAWSMTPGTTYDLAARIAGRRVQLFAKARVTTAAGWANAATYSLIAEFLFDAQARRKQSGKNYAGLALSQDVWVDLPAFAASPYDDIEQSLTKAGNNAALNDFSMYSTTAQAQTDQTKISVFSSAAYVVGQYIRLYSSAYGYSSRHQISDINGGIITLTAAYASSIPNGANIDVYTLGDTSEWGWADCGKRTATALGGTPVITDPLAEKKPRQVIGRAAFASDDSTAVSIRYVVCDGVRFSLRSGDVNGSRTAWDYGANPIAQADDAFYSAGSVPNAWRAVFHHGFVFSGTPADVKLPDTGYLDVEDECIRYAPFTFYRRGMVQQRTWTLVPTYYAPLQAAATGTTTITNWKARTSTGVVGDDFGSIASPKGLLVEISSRNGGRINNDKQYYVAQTTSVTPSAGNDAASYITLNTGYENSIAGTDTVTLAGNGDIAIVSGRGQFGTKKATHASGAPVRYSPRDVSTDGLTGALPTIRVNAWDCFSGGYQSLEDMLRRMTAIAGLRNPAFRNRFTSPASPVTRTLTTSAYALPLDSTLANFVLDARVHIPGNSTNSGGVISANSLKIGFRGYYMLYIGQYATAADYAAGRPGVLSVGLATTSTDISAASDGVRWLERAYVPLTDANIAGAVSGTSPNFTLAEDVTKLVDLRVTAQNGLVSVEVNGAPVWTFNLDRFTDGTTSYRKDAPGSITLAYALSIAGYTATIRVQELGEEVARYTAPRGSQVSAAINAISQARRLRTRAGVGGAVEFSRFQSRDNAGTLSENLWADSWTQSDLVQRGHMLVAGDATGEYVDPTVIVTDGYKFGATTSNSVSTSEDATNEARLLMREAAEFDETRGVDGVGLLEVQPEDRIALVYGGEDDMPQHASSDHVVTAVNLRASTSEVTGSYTLRRYIA